MQANTPQPKGHVANFNKDLKIEPLWRGVAAGSLT
jgi:hypothetical protein